MAWLLNLSLPVMKGSDHTNILWRAAMHAFALLFALACVPHTLHAADIMVGSSGKSTRIVIYIKAPDDVVPDMEQQNQTLIVKFPYTVASGCTIRDRHLIQELTFDGRTARVEVKRPFTYTSSLRQMPSRVVIDIKEKKEAHSATSCPVTRIETSFSDGKARVALFLAPGSSADIRASKSAKIFLSLSDAPVCGMMEHILSSCPILDLSGVVSLKAGMVAQFTVNPLFRLKSSTYDRDRDAFVLVFDPSGKGTPVDRFNLAMRLFRSSDYTGVIQILKNPSRDMEVREKALLARALWASSFPYEKGEKAKRAITLMEQAALDAEMQDDPQGLMLEYTEMLIRTGRAAEAMQTLKELEGAPDKHVRIKASVLLMAALNATGAFQEAYTQSHRIDLNQAGTDMPGDFIALYSATMGDTYLGLNDYKKAMEYYQKALSADPAYPRHDPGITGRMGEALLKAKEYQDAKEYLVEAANLAPPAQMQKYLVMLGDCLYELGEKDRAYITFLHAEGVSPEGDGASIAKLKRTRIIIENNTDERGKLSDKGFNEAMDIYNSLLSSVKDSEGESLTNLVKIRMAQAYARHGDEDMALGAYLDVWRGSKKNSDIRTFAHVEAVRLITSLCSDLHKKNRYDRINEIYRLYKDSFIKELSDGSTQYILGEALYHGGYMEEARKLLEASTQSDSAYKEQAFSLLFAIDFKQERFQEALLWNTIYLSTYPKGSEVSRMRHFRGVVLYEIGSIDAAVPFLEETSSPDNPYALESLRILAEIYRTQGKKEQERHTLDRIIAFHPARRSPVVEKALYIRANDLREEGDLTRAKELYRALLDTYPRSFYAHWAMYFLGQIQRDLGDFEEAGALLGRVKSLSRDPVLLGATKTALDDLELDKDVLNYEKKRSSPRGD